MSGPKRSKSPSFHCQAKKGFDCIQIPGLQKNTGKRLKFSRICGREKKLASNQDTNAEKTLCSNYTTKALPCHK